MVMVRAAMVVGVIARKVLDSVSKLSGSFTAAAPTHEFEGTARGGASAQVVEAIGKH